MAAEQVFISYKREDSTFAFRLYDDLKQAGIDAWIDQKDIHSGNWDDQVERALRESAIMVLIVTPESMASQNVADEWNFFRNKEKPIIPVILRATDMPFRLARWQQVDFTNAYQIGKLIDEINKLGGHGSIPSEPTPSNVPTDIPYRPFMPPVQPEPQPQKPVPPPIPNATVLTTLVTQPMELAGFTTAFPEIASMMYQFSMLSDLAAIGQSWQMIRCFNMARSIPATLQRLDWRGGGVITLTSPMGYCYSMGALHVIGFELHAFGSAAGPTSWIGDQALRQTYIMDGAFANIVPAHSGVPFSGALLGTSVQYNLCPGIPLTTSELWIPNGIFLMICRVWYRGLVNAPAPLQILVNGTQACFTRLRAAGW